METLVVVNPASAGGRTGKRWPALEPLFRQHLGDFALVMTTAPGHGAEVVRSALTDRTVRVIAVGGDGTNHEILNGMIDPVRRAPLRPDAVFGFVTAGTGCDLGRTLGMPRAPELAVAWLAQRTPQPTDLLALAMREGQERAEFRVAANIITLGVGGMTCRLVNMRPKIGSTLPFLLAGIESVLRTRPWRLTLRDLRPRPGTGGIDAFDPAMGEARSVDVRYVVCANAQYNGGGMHIAPEARIDDGELDAITLGPLADLPLLLATRRFYDGSIGQHPLAQTWRTRGLDIAPDPDGPPCYLEADGEPCGPVPARIWTLPGAVLMLR